MPVADDQTYCRMLGRARREKAMAERVERVTTELRSAGTARVNA